MYHRVAWGLTRIEEFQKIVKLSFRLLVAMSPSSRNREGEGGMPVIGGLLARRPLEVSRQSTARQPFLTYSQNTIIHLCETFKSTCQAVDNR
jgi:hypothetical protein